MAWGPAHKPPPPRLSDYVGRIDLPPAGEACGYADRYQAKRRPTCNGGNPCRACLAKWVDALEARVDALERELRK